MYIYNPPICPPAIMKVKSGRLYIYFGENPTVQGLFGVCMFIKYASALRFMFYL